MLSLKSALIAAALLAMAPAAVAQPPAAASTAPAPSTPPTVSAASTAPTAVPVDLSSPVGTWETIDDNTGKPKALVRISEVDGALQGTVVKVLQSDQGPNPICAKCSGKRKDQPVLGMTIMWGLHKDGNQWDGGHILDPKTGHIYKCKLWLIDAGRQLKVRGYMGFALFGRTQVWIRQPQA